MKLVALTLVTLAISACGDRGLAPPAMTQPAALPQSLGCATDGTFAFSLTARALGPWEGKAAHAVAYEPALGWEGVSAGRTPVDVWARIDGEQAAFHCPSALRENDSYPSLAVFVDVDGDGRCGAGDVGSQLSFFGWGEESFMGGLELPRAAWEEAPSVPGDWQPVAALGGRIGGAAEGFCASFFP